MRFSMPLDFVSVCTLFSSFVCLDDIWFGLVAEWPRFEKELLMFYLVETRNHCLLFLALCQFIQGH